MGNNAQHSSFYPIITKGRFRYPIWISPLFPSPRACHYFWTEKLSSSRGTKKNVHKRYKRVGNQSSRPHHPSLCGKTFWPSYCIMFTCPYFIASQFLSLVARVFYAMLSWTMFAASIGRSRHKSLESNLITASQGPQRDYFYIFPGLHIHFWGVIFSSPVIDFPLYDWIPNQPLV